LIELTDDEKQSNNNTVDHPIDDDSSIPGSVALGPSRCDVPGMGGRARGPALSRSIFFAVIFKTDPFPFEGPEILRWEQFLRARAIA
jgi:hypothetical protein